MKPRGAVWQRFWYSSVHDLGGRSAVIFHCGHGRVFKKSKMPKGRKAVCYQCSFMASGRGSAAGGIKARELGQLHELRRRNGPRRKLRVLNPSDRYPRGRLKDLRIRGRGRF